MKIKRQRIKNFLEIVNDSNTFIALDPQQIINYIRYEILMLLKSSMESYNTDWKSTIIFNPYMQCMKITIVSEIGCIKK